jgi:ketosteroid isomerase-like protein
MIKGTAVTMIVGLAVMMAGAASPSPVPGEDRPEDRDAIRAHIDSIFKAYIAGDREVIRATHHPEWRGFFRVSRSSVRGIDAYMREAERALTAEARMTSYRMMEFDVLFYGDMALVPYVAELQIAMAGQSFPASLRVFDVYAKLDGHWIQVGSHTTLHPDTAAARRQYPTPVAPPVRAQILEAREAVWRALFRNDQNVLSSVIPPETIAINAGTNEWSDQRGVLAEAEAFAAGGGRLVNLQFPETSIQLYGDVAILYTTYSTTLETDEGTRTLSGRGTEIFVRRNGVWINPGWHLDSGQ